MGISDSRDRELTEKETHSTKEIGKGGGKTRKKQRKSSK